MLLRKITIGVLLSTLLNSIAFAEATSSDSNNQKIDELLVTLSNDSENCQLSSKKGTETITLSLPLTSPCYWITKQESTEAQHYSYEDVSQVFLIAGSELDWTDEKKEHQKLPIDTYCSQYLQGIAIENENVVLLGEKMDAPNCEGQFIDEKVFHSAALQQKAETELAENQKDEEGLFDSIKKTFKQLFASESEDN